ncbi:hypothetical protein CYMTET_38678 [Cymbomonas tetramitiformis]|uniref:Uncharacterized protein n=1 Tax=Cymbomonas tetramitiformis TaxID=36881 RepID=A0AAE0F590_9CHLO|nr:hypothetical protein CYMTET_38678 [Cymbomonas tetramitiformis]
MSQPSQHRKDANFNHRRLRSNLGKLRSRRKSDLNVAIKRLNDAVLQDRVTYGASWPVQARKCLSLESELTRILN